MSPCEHLSDRMPDVARGGTWTADELVHLEQCVDCSAEWGLVRTAQTLGLGVGEELNPHHVAERVLGRVRADQETKRVRRWGFALAGLAAAAAVVVAVSAGPARRSAAGTPVAVAANLVLPELDSLRAPELEVLLRTMDRPVNEGSIDLAPPVPTDLEGEDLDGVLEALEG